MMSAASCCAACGGGPGSSYPDTTCDECTPRYHSWVCGNCAHTWVLPTMVTPEKCEHCRHDSLLSSFEDHGAAEDYSQSLVSADDDTECEGHESTSGPIGNVVYCDGSCRPRA